MHHERYFEKHPVVIGRYGAGEPGDTESDPVCRGKQVRPCETMGWDIDKGYIELDFSSQLVDGVPYLVLGHRVPPVYLGW